MYFRQKMIHSPILYRENALRSKDLNVKHGMREPLMEDAHYMEELLELLIVNYKS